MFSWQLPGVRAFASGCKRETTLLWRMKAAQRSGLLLGRFRETGNMSGGGKRRRRWRLGIGVNPYICVVRGEVRKRALATLPPLCLVEVK